MTLQNPNEPPFGPMDYDFARPTNIDRAGDYQESKPGLGKIYKENAVASSWNGEQPLITPQELRDIHLFGIPPVSAIRDPLTNRPAIMTDPLIKRFINEAVTLGEAELKIDIFPTQYVEAQAFDRAAYDSMGYFQLRHRPIASLESITVSPANEMPQLLIPLDWVSVSYLHLGQVNLLPLTLATRGNAVVPLATSPMGQTWLSLISGGKPWVSSLFEFMYTTGFKEGCIPGIINQFLGTVAAMEILSVLASTYSRSTSTSLGIDGLSQGISSPGADIFTVRLTQLAEKRGWLRGRIQAALGASFIVDNV